MANRFFLSILILMAACAFHPQAEASGETMEQIGRQAVEAALSKLDAGPESKLACITNAGYATYEGAGTRILFDVIPKYAQISLGAGNLLSVHSRCDDSLWFAFLKKEQDGKLPLTYVGIREGVPVATGPIDVYVGKNQPFEPFKKVLGEKAFSVVTLANGWSDHVPEDLMQGALYHDHLCSGVFSGYFTVRFIQKALPLEQGERYIYVGAPAWCQDDYLMAPLNLTPGKHGYYTMDYPWYRPWKTEKEVYDKLGGIVIRHNRETDKGKACLLRFDWQEAEFKKFIEMPDLKLDWKTQPWLHVLYNRFFMSRLDRPELFVSVLKEKPLENQTDLNRLIKMGANPLAEMLGPDSDWEKGL